MPQYEKLSDELVKQIEADRVAGKKSEFAFDDAKITRRSTDHDRATIFRPAFVRDIEKIMHVPYYNRLSDKTQVYSFYKNDDISRRALHVQFVARIARNIGRALGLNEDLIEAAALGHDIGHTPFGHAGERILNEIYRAHTGRFFNHNVHSVRVLDGIVKRNISLQTLDAIICHNGELELQKYEPCTMTDFDEFDRKYEECYTQEAAIKRLVPCTLEGCVVRISDIIAYLGKDRQDAQKLGFGDTAVFSSGRIGTTNAEIINNLSVNIIENSYGKPYLMMEQEFFDALKAAKNENYKMIYQNEELDRIYKNIIKPMFEQMYEALLRDLLAHNHKSFIYTHHIDYINKSINQYGIGGYEDTEPNQIVVDYLAGMTDDYFLELYKEMFPASALKVEYKGYF